MATNQNKGNKNPSGAKGKTVVTLKPTQGKLKATK